LNGCMEYMGCGRVDKDLYINHRVKMFIKTKNLKLLMI
jgi:hypothetical protein